MSHTLIDVAELLAEIATTYECEGCNAGLAVHVEHEGQGDHEYGGDWYVVVMHADSCSPTPPRPRTLRLVETSHGPRCRSCGGLLLLDIGGGPDGEMETVAGCPRCEPRPTVYDTGGAA